MNVRELYRKARGIQALAATERDSRSSVSLPLRRRFWLWRRGFLSRSGVLYDLDDQTADGYVTDYQRFVRTKSINGTWSVALSNKLLFHWMMRPFVEHRMPVYGVLRGGRFHPVDALECPTQSGPPARPDGGSATLVDRSSGTQERAAATAVLERLREDDRLVLKWIRGGGGNNVLFCSRTDDEYHINGETYTEAEFSALVGDLEEYLVCAFVEQGSFPAGLYPETPNTVRIVTMYDEDAGEAFVAAAIQRIGTEASRPMDNFSQGGLSAAVDVEIGELGPGVSLPRGGSELEWHVSHPDTDSPIAGARIPAWPTIRDRILELAESCPFVPYVGWDIVVTGDDGEFTLIEGNSYPGLKSIQVHGPLLTDERVRRFYEHHGVR